MEADPLFYLRNHFYLGNFATAIQVGSEIQPNNDEAALERDCFIYRAYLAMQNFNVVMSEITNQAPRPLQAIKLMGAYLQARSEENREVVLETIKDWLGQQPLEQAHPIVLLVAGQIHALQQNFKEALRCFQARPTLELMANAIQIYLKIDRSNLAEKQLKVMQEMDDDATLTQLAHAWINVSIGGEKFQEAFFTFQDLSERYAKTPLLLNALAVCHMHTGKFQEAFGLLADANKGNDPDTLINLITCSQHLRKPQELVTRYITQLKSGFPEHPYTQSIVALEHLFDRAASSFTFSAPEEK